MILKVAWSLIIITAILEDISTEVHGFTAAGSRATAAQPPTTEPSTTTLSAMYAPCKAPLKNIAVYEGDLNTFIYYPTSPNAIKWGTVATTNESDYVYIVHLNDAVDPNYEADYAFNSSGLTIKNATTTAEPGHKLSTAGFYTAEIVGGDTFSFKFLVVRQGPACSCAMVNSSTVQLTCSSIYAENTYESISAIFTLFVDGNLIASDTTERTVNDQYTWISTSTFTTAYSDSSTYECGQTFSQLTDVYNPNVVMNAPTFDQKCSFACGGPIATTKSSTSSPSSTTTTTSSTTGAYEQCFTSLTNTVVYEGTLDTMLNSEPGPNDRTWMVWPTSNPTSSYDISFFTDILSPSLTGLYAINQTGLIVRNSTTTNATGVPISTAGLYLVKFAKTNNRIAFKLVVIRSGPICSCIQSSSVDVISCTMIYADNPSPPINAIMNCTANGQFYTSTTPTKTLLPYTPTQYVYNSTSTIIVSNTVPAIYDCLVTFAAPLSANPPTLAPKAPDFNATSTVYCEAGTSSSTLTTQSSTTTLAPNRTTTSPTTTLQVSMEPLFGPIAGGTNITIIVSATIDYISKYIGSNITDVRNVYTGKDLSSTSVLLKPNHSSTFDLVAVTPSTTKESIGKHLPIIIEFSPTPFNMTFNKEFIYLPNPEITGIYPNHFIVDGGTLLDVFGKSLSSVAKPIIQLTVVITRSAENRSTITTSTTTTSLTTTVTPTMSTSRVCTVPPGNDTYMQCPMPPLNLPQDFLEVLNPLYNTSSSGKEQHTNSSDVNVLTVRGPNGIDRADIYLGIIFDGYKEYENINDALPDTKFTFYSAPEINSSDEVIEFDPSEDELIYVKGRYMLRGCRLRDYLVHIGNQICINDNLTDNELSCRPPKEKPSSTGNEANDCDQHLSITITLGYKQYQYACLTYTDNSKTFALIVGLTVGLVGFALFLTILIACIVRCRRKKVLSQETYRHADTGGQELRNPHFNTDVEPESHQDYIIYTRQNTISLYTRNDEYSTSIDENYSNS